MAQKTRRSRGSAARGGGGAGSGALVGSIGRGDGVLMRPRSVQFFRRGPLEGRDGDAVVGERLDQIRFGARERGLRVRQLDDAAGAGRVAPLRELDVLACLATALLRDADGL